MDVVWLLNAFAASEISYSSARLSAYVDGSRPAGIVLDYDDQPRTRDAWMQPGTQAIAPVIRSTHFWTTADNALGKIGTAIDSGSGGPDFLWLTVYTFRFDLNDAQSLVGQLSRRMGGNLEVVTPSAFFDLLRADFVRTAQSRLGAMEGDPIASILFSGMMESARARLQEAEASISVGDTNRAAYSSYLGSRISGPFPRQRRCLHRCSLSWSPQRLRSSPIALLGPRTGRRSGFGSAFS